MIEGEYCLVKLVEEVKESALELKSDWRYLCRYLLETEVHVYAFSIAGNVLLAFWPFMIVMLWLFRYAIGWSEAELAIYAGIRDFFPGESGAFLTYNLKQVVLNSRRLEWPSLLLLLFTANGIFLPLEVALNRAWGVKVNRSLLRNQLVSLGLIVACGLLLVVAASISGAGQMAWTASTGLDFHQFAYDVEHNWHASDVPIPIAILSKLTSIPFTILSVFLIFCYLPNADVPKRAILSRVVVVALILEGLKWISLITWPWVYGKFAREYGVFVNSVTILTWSFLAGLVVLAGADWTARHARAVVTSPAPHVPFQDRIDSESVL